MYYLLGSILVLSCFGAIAHGAPRVVGGHDAPNHKYPYQVSLRSFHGHFCSGSILNQRWILTAAHCVDGVKTKDFTISAGTNYLNVPGDVYSPQFIIIHEQFESFYYYDVALIRVVEEIAFNEFVKPILLPEVDQDDYSTPASFAGWGSMVLGGPLPNNLQEIQLNVLTVEKCKEEQRLIDFSHICTYTKVDEGICHSDSGGPLVVDGVQVGIASYVIPCAVGIPDVYTRVFAYKDWIETNTERFAHDFH